MNITTRMTAIRENTDYIAASVHYKKRAFDKQFEIVARISDAALDELGVNIGGEIVLDVQENRQYALDSVRFFRKQES